MRLNETDPALRRIELTILVADGSALATSVDAASPTVLVARNGATLVSAGGALGHVSNETRLHYYEASASEATIPGFLLVVVIQAGIQTAIAWAPVGQIFALGETDTAKLRMPMTIYDDSEPPALATGVTASGSQLASSVNGGSFATDPGSLVEIGHGAYYWQATAAAAAVAGFITARVDVSGFGVCLSWIDVESPSGTAIAPPGPAVGPAAIKFLAEAAPTILTVDYIALALSRLPSQYRGTNG